MDDLPSAVGEALLKEVECPVCMEYMVPSINLCTNGHNICGKCRGRVHCCPTCRASFSDIRNLVLENIAERSQKYPCANRQRGCLELLPFEHFAGHKAVCVYGKIKCPFVIHSNCTWNGFKSDLKGHAKTAHNEYFYELSSIRAPLFKDRTLCILSCFGKLFVPYKRIRDGRFYCAVRLIGTSSEAFEYKCEFTLRAANGIEQISKTFLVRGYSEDFETIFNSGICFCLDEAVVRRHFLVENKLDLTIALSTVHDREKILAIKRNESLKAAGLPPEF